jgi:aspartyl-tRNA(Asn)/glutamyl-tRNA(Gln) amidotransferase subunit C
LIDKKTVNKIADLARLELNEGEITSFTKDLDTILEYVEQLNEADTENVEPTSFMVPRHNPLRDDVEKESLPKEKTLQNGPCVKKGFFAIPKVIQ